MSWDAYVTALTDRGMAHGAICGLDGSWMKCSPGSNITQAELKTVLDTYGKDSMFATGVFLGGKKYMYLSSNLEISPFPLRIKKGEDGAHFCKSNTTMMVGLYDKNKKAEEAAVAVESVIESLIKANC